MSTTDPQGQYQPQNDPAAHQPPAAPYGAVPGQPAPAAPKKGGKGKFIALGCGLLALLAILVFGGCTVLMVSSSDSSDDATPAQSVTEEEAPA